jgi:hypothetical protein
LQGERVMVKKWQKINKNTSDYIVDIFSEYELEETNIKMITKLISI